MHAFPYSFPAVSWTSLDVANHLWQSTVAAVAVLGLLFVARNLSARTRRTLGWMALAKFFLPIAALTRLVALTGGTPERWLESRALTLPLTLSPKMFSSTTVAADPARNVAGPFLVGVWLAGFVALFGSWIVRGRSLRRQTLSHARPLSPTLEHRLAVASQSVGLKKSPHAYAVDGDHSPGALGFFSPMVILPSGIEDTLTPDELQSVLIHECVHLRRHDNFLSALQALVVSLLWFHPLVWALNRQLRLETEKSCDERVLEITRDAEAYASGIVKCVRHSLGLAQPLLIGVSTPPVLARIKNILAHPSRREQPLARLAVLTIGLLAITLSGHAGTFGRTPVAVAPKSVAVSAAEIAAAPVAPPATPVAEVAAPSTNASNADLVATTRLMRTPTPVVEISAIEPSTPKPAVTLSSTSDIPTPATAPVVSRQPEANAVVTTLVSSAAPVEKLSPQLAMSETPKVKLAAAEPASPAGELVWDVSKLDRAPWPRLQPKPQYPFAMRRSGVSGDATVDFIVDTHGDVRNAYAIRSSHKEFEAAAVAAVVQWKFKPGMKQNQAVNTHMQVPIVFRIGQ